jgi:hypothetical protein
MAFCSRSMNRSHISITVGEPVRVGWEVVEGTVLADERSLLETPRRADVLSPCGAT